MRLRHLLFSFLVPITLSGSALAAPRTLTLDVPGMTCPTCPIALRKVLFRQKGVSGVAVLYDLRQLVVSFDDALVTPADLTKATASIGFPSHIESAKR